MSYCRFSDGDVYMYPSGKGIIECCACRLPGGDFRLFSTKQDALDHLMWHKRAGHKVPQHAIDRLKREATYQQ